MAEVHVDDAAAPLVESGEWDPAPFLRLCTRAVQRPRPTEILQAGNGVELTLAVLRGPVERRVQAAAVYVLCTLAQAGDPSAREAIAKEITTLLGAMAQRPADAELHRGTLDIVSHLCAAGCARLLLDSHAVAAAVQAINQHRDVEAVQVSGLEALRGLMAVPQGRTAVLKGGGVEAMLAAMQAHPSSPAVQTRGCQALSCLCAADYQAPTVVRLGGVEVILAALKLLRGAPDVQAAACGALWLLSALDQAQAALVSANGLPGVVAAMAHCPESVAVQRDGCKILWRLASAPAHAPRVAASGAPRALLEAVRSPAATGDCDVSYYGKLALRTLAAGAGDPSAAEALAALATTA